MKRKYLSLSMLSLLLLCGCDRFMLYSSSSSSGISSNISSSKIENSSTMQQSTNHSVVSSENSVNQNTSSNKVDSSSTQSTISNVVTSSSLEQSTTSSVVSSSTSSSVMQSSSSIPAPTYTNILNTSWKVYGDGDNTISLENTSPNSFNLYINNVNPSEKYSTQCLNNPLAVQEGYSYQVNITLKSSVTRSIVMIMQEGNYSYYDLNKTLDLVANVEQTFTFDFVASKTQTNMLFGLLTGKIGSGYEGAHTIKVSNPQILGVDNNNNNNNQAGPGENTTTDTPSKEGYNILWADEFNGTEIDTKNWSFEEGHGSSGWGNNERQYYTNRKENAFVEDGALNIVARKEKYSGARYEYTSARMISMDKVEFMYGYVEARIAVPLMTGIWPAFWMLGANFDEIGWPSCGEIDIMEAINDERNVVYSTLHWKYTPGNSQADHGNGGAYINDRTKYHTYGMNWTKEKIEIFVDGVNTFTMGIDGGNGLEAFQKPHFFILNVAVGGNWPGFTIANEFPQTMMVDYIRVYQPK